MKACTKDRIRNIGTVTLAAVLVSGLCLRSLTDKDKEYSAAERRLLAQMPKASVSRILDGSFMKEFETYVSDQFPYREEFRSLKALTSMKLFCRSDYNKLYEQDGHISKYESVIYKESLDYAGERFQYIYDAYLAGTNTNLYFTVIPDKNWFLAEKSGHPRLDYPLLCAEMQERTPYLQYIDISGLLDENDYYFTDTHWRQERVADVAWYLAESMGRNAEAEYKINVLPDPFYGVYSGQAAWKSDPDIIRYLTNDTIDSLTVTSYATGKAEESVVYNFDKADGKDSYEFFLSGSEPFLVIENGKAETDAELVLFRDSFGSSLAPLLAEGYRKITVIDIRYVKSAFIGQLIKFDSQDVLFMYSDTLLNNSTAMN